MADFIHKTSSEIDGPFLLDRTQLESLDKTLREEWARFEEEYDKTLSESVEKTFCEERRHSWNEGQSDEALRASIRDKLKQSYEFRKVRQCAITLDNGSIAKVTDFSAAFREPELQDKTPTGFVVGMESAGRKCYVTLTRRSMEVEVAPKGDYFVQQTLTMLKNWQNSVRPSFWQSLWHKWSFMAWFVWFGLIFGSLQIFDRQYDHALKAEYTQQALSLVTNGIAPDKQGKAMELLLVNAYNLSPSKSISKFPGWFLLLAFGGLVYCILLSIKPDVAVAIGRGEGKVQCWRKYSKFILITAPFFIFITFLWPKIETVLKSWF